VLISQAYGIPHGEWKDDWQGVNIIQRTKPASMQLTYIQTRNLIQTAMELNQASAMPVQYLRISNMWYDQFKLLFSQGQGKYKLDTSEKKMPCILTC
jgi:hypothetical protein